MSNFDLFGMKTFAKLIAVHCVRNTIIEKYHSEGKGIKINLEKRIKNLSGDILVRPYLFNEGKEYYDGMPIIEALNLYDNNNSGCAVVFWELRKCDDSWIIEAHEIHDRLTTTKYDEGVLEEMFHWGRKMSDIVIDFIIKANL